MLEEEEVVGNSLDDPLTSHIGGGTQASLWGSNFTKHTQNLKNTHTCSPDKSTNLSREKPDGDKELCEESIIPVSCITDAFRWEPSKCLNMLISYLGYGTTTGWNVG